MTENEPPAIGDLVIYHGSHEYYYNKLFKVIATPDLTFGLYGNTDPNRGYILEPTWVSGFGEIRDNTLSNVHVRSITKYEANE